MQKGATDVAWWLFAGVASPGVRLLLTAGVVNCYYICAMLVERRDIGQAREDGAACSVCRNRSI